MLLREHTRHAIRWRFASGRPSDRLAATAADLLPEKLDPEPAGRGALECLGDVLTELAQIGLAAARARRQRGMDDARARQMRGQRPAGRIAMRNMAQL